MSGRLRSVFLAALLACTTLLSGCLFGGTAIVTSLELEASSEILAFGETTELTARGRTENGKVVSVIPKWEIISGSGTLGETDFQASDWNYVGEVVLRATYNGISDEIALEILGLLGEDYVDPFPRPGHPNASIPEVTEEFLVKVGQPLDSFSELGELLVMGRRMVGWCWFMRNGEIIQPSDPKPGAWATAKWHEKLPDKVHLSHRVRYELIDCQVLDRGTNYSNQVSNRKGTTFQETKELAERLTSETHAEAGWSWGRIETTLTYEISKRTQQTVKIEEEQTVTRTWSFVNPNDYDTYLYTSWNKVDIFYLSDRNGVPLEESPIFAGYNFYSYPIEIRGRTVVQKTWGYNKANQ